MTEDIKRSLKVFLCHAHEDKAAVRKVYKRLVDEGINAWLDEEKLLPGQDWNNEILRALQESDVIVICFSKISVAREGYVQREIKEALKKAEEKPSGTIFVIPAKLNDCEVPFYLRSWQWVNLFENNGFQKLLLSLKLRADNVGAVIKRPSSEDEDTELDKRLEQLYTDGLAAFYTEDWDRACKRFEAILREQPNHENAAEKLAEAERQRNLARLYAQATEAYQLENWPAASKALEELLEKSGDYKSAIELLQNAKKQKKLQELYAEAKRLHAGQKWHAVIRVFDQIAPIDPAYPDPDGLLSSAQKEVSKLKRLDELNNLYAQGLRAMESGHWSEARGLLEQVHKTQTGFLETERLLRRIDNEIAKIEELNKRNIYINTLYEQAHGLVRSRNWREALDKIQEIQRLDDKFEDKDGIAETAMASLKLEEEGIRRQNQLAAIYADAVRLLREGKYQEALDKWQEVKTMDPKYPDRQSVQRIAQNRLVEHVQGIRIFQRVGFISLLVVTLVVIIWLSFQNFRQPPGSTTPSALPTAKSLTPSSTTPSAYWYWHFSNNSDGWDAGFEGVSRPTHDGDCGCIMFTAKGNNPYIYSPSTEILASSMSMITISMKVEGSKSNTGAIYFVTNKDNEFNEDKKRVFLRIEDESFHTYDINMLGIPGWQDTVTQLRLEPVNDQNAKVTINYIWVHTPNNSIISGAIAVTKSPTPLKSPTPSALATPKCPKTETVTVPFDKGLDSTRTRYSYSGNVLIIVSGTGQASGGLYSDAFYVFTASKTRARGWSLSINGKLAKEFIVGNQIPAYQPNHIYSFNINAPDGPLSFGVADLIISDNTGSYQVELCGS